MLINQASLNNLQQLIANGNCSSVHVLVDENTKASCLPLIELTLEKYFTIEIVSGEWNKTFETVQFIWKSLSEQQANRDSLLINLGGGVICDMGAFAAATYMRGIKFIHVPTTLLAMVDASIGGKAAINFMHLKNNIGLFVLPEMIVVEAKFLESLSDDQKRSGMAEVVKHSWIAGEDSIRKLEISELNYSEVITDSFRLKSEIVERDFTETGERKKLNAGHTVAHALEAYALMSGKELQHGDAVASGLMIESILSYKRGLLSNENLERLRRNLTMHCNFVQIPNPDLAQLIGLMHHDKKIITQKINCSLIASPGNVHVNVEVSDDEMLDALKTFYAG